MIKNEWDEPNVLYDFGDRIEDATAGLNHEQIIRFAWA